MRTKYIVANWKMNKTPSEAVALATALKQKLATYSDADVAVCPPFIDLPGVIEVLSDTPIDVGAQNLYLHDSGAFTGEIAGPMIKAAGCSLAIVGHSERRSHFAETDELIHDKLICALDYGLRPILCVGETLQEREHEQTKHVIESQVQVALSGLSQERLGDLTIAYEPVWAIGTGRNATPEQVVEVHAFIRDLVRDLLGKQIAERLRIQYGGSVNPQNCDGLLARPEIDGALVGGASLDADKFAIIVEAGNKYSS